MRRIIASTFVSLDGIMQAPGGPDEDRSGGFQFGGWVAPHSSGGAVLELFSRPFDLLLGRKTYDIWAAYWPLQTDPNNPIATSFNRVTKYVASRGTPSLSWAHSKGLGPDAVAGVKALKAGEGPDLIVQGSGNFLQTLWRNRLVDVITVMTFPVLLGSGKRLFEDGVAPSGLKLVSSETSPDGVVIATYHPDGAVKTGIAG